MVIFLAMVKWHRVLLNEALINTGYKEIRDAP
jgi:hypothetical protein